MACQDLRLHCSCSDGVDPGFLDFDILVSQTDAVNTGHIDVQNVA